MQSTSIILLSVLPYSVFSFTIPIPGRTCGVESPSDELVKTHDSLRQAERLNPTLFNTTTFREAQNGMPSSDPHPLSLVRRAPSMYIIPIWFHIVSSTAASDPSNVKYVSETMWRDQYSYIIKQYSNSSIFFDWQGITRTTDDTWATGSDDVGMKTALRQGTYGTLNVYFQSDLQSASLYFTSAPLLGVCSLPSSGITSSTPKSSYITDGCNILSGTMPGGVESGYNLGGTAVHEIGHWNGLLHTFEDYSCATNDKGDYIPDTPQESTSTKGCPEGKDSCFTGYNPDDPTAVHTVSGYAGPDPIHNFMDYSTDACYQGFTSGQAARMWNMFPLFRQGR